MKKQTNKLSNLTNTKKNQIIIGSIWVLLEIGIFIILHMIDAVTAKNQIFTTFIIGFGILGLWILIRWTMFEKLQLKLKTFTDKKTSEKSDLIAVEMDVKEYREFRKSKSNFGFYVLGLVNAILIIVWIAL